MKHLLQIDWTDLQYTADEFSRDVYSFPVTIRVLIGVTLVFIFIIVVLLGVILGSRIYKTQRENKRNYLRTKYQPIFTKLLFDDDAWMENSDVFQQIDETDLKIQFHREVLNNEIIHLHSNFTGETALRLEKLYVILQFHEDAYKRLQSKQWHIVAKAMRELALMNVQEAHKMLSRFLNSKNEILRMEARVAMMKLSDSEPLSFLSKETEPLTDWDKANIHAMLTRMKEPVIPDFTMWLNSPNKTVIHFCIMMIGYYRQQESAPVLVKMLDHPDEYIRLAAIRALRELNAHSSEENLITLYPLETSEIQHEILKTLEVIGKDKSTHLLEKILKQPITEYRLAIQAVRALLVTSPLGQQKVKEMQQHGEPVLQSIILHALDKRL
ncbi:MAG TPA: HEAT repeat domain-containing protein [Bacteroidia bacterium]|nr:HEAT repeat domain-containing protein [Bacteroidia bacterium]